MGLVAVYQASGLITPYNRMMNFLWQVWSMSEQLLIGLPDGLTVTYTRNHAFLVQCLYLITPGNRAG